MGGGGGGGSVYYAISFYYERFYFDCLHIALSLDRCNNLIIKDFCMHHVIYRLNIYTSDLEFVYS